MINLEINKKEIIYDGKEKKYGKKGVIPINEKLDHEYVYVIFPFDRKSIGGKVHIIVDSMYIERITDYEDQKSKTQERLNKYGDWYFMDLRNLLEQYYIIKDDENYGKFIQNEDFEAFERLVDKLVEKLK